MRYLFNSFFEMEEKGAWSRSLIERYDINCSSILTRLIQEAGRVCRYYASDLFIEWKGVEASLSAYGEGTETFAFGFYKSGVYGENNLRNMGRGRNGSVSPEELGLYSIFVLTIVKDGKDIKMVLKEATSYSTD